MYSAVVIGVSAGGLYALEQIIPVLPVNYKLAVMIVQHRAESSDDYLEKHLNEISNIRVKQAELREPVKTGCVYIAPPGYHLLVERNRIFGLSVDSLVNYSMPSIDVLFESAAKAYQHELVGVLLTGANSDGSDGMLTIKNNGGFTVVQDPKTAEIATMPESAIKKVNVDKIIALDKIGRFLSGINNRKVEVA